MTIIDPSSATDYLDKGVVVRPFAAFIDASFVLVRRGDGVENQLVEQFTAGFWDYHDRLLQQSSMF